MYKNLKKIINSISNIEKSLLEIHNNKIQQGNILSVLVKMNKLDFADAEFSIFSQFGDDGIIQFLINNLQIENKYFVEFGVEDYEESNTRFLMMHNNWSGFVMDGSQENIQKILTSRYFWKYNLTAKVAFITKENINQILRENVPIKEIGLLHIDLDGNDYWIWKEIDKNIINPVIVILEYNCVFGNEKALTVPYNESFLRTNAHFSNLYWGASLKALYNLSINKGYSFVGCNSAGNNAYFVRNDKLNEKIHSTNLESGFVESKYRESRDEKGNKSYLAGTQRLQAIKGLKVFNTETNNIESL